MTDPVYFCVHVPKCAGTTVEAHFARTLGDAFLIAPRWNSPLRHLLGNRVTLTAAEQSSLRVVSGHSLMQRMAPQFAGRDVRECVLLRDPLGYSLSFYNYRLERHEVRGDPKPPAFPAWYRAQRRNPISRFLLTRYFGVGYPELYTMSSRARLAFLEDRLAGFHFVGSYRQCDAMVAGIARDLGVAEVVERANVGKVKTLIRDDLAPEMQARIVEENALDQLLFDRWAERGFSHGAPDGLEAALAKLPAGDGLSYLASDITSAVRREMWR